MTGPEYIGEDDRSGPANDPATHARRDQLHAELLDRLRVCDGAMVVTMKIEDDQARYTVGWITPPADLTQTLHFLKDCVQSAQHSAGLVAQKAAGIIIEQFNDEMGPGPAEGEVRDDG